MFRSIKKMLSLLLVALMLVGVFSGCGGKKQEANIDPAVGNKTIVVSLAKGGYGEEWIYALAEAFEETYKEEGYKVELDIRIGDSGDIMTQELKLGPERNDIDLYFAGNVTVRNVMEFSKKVMLDDTTPILAPLDDVYYSPAIGADKKEESKTIAERVSPGFEESFIYESDNEWNGKVFTLGAFTAATGIAANPAVFARYGIALPNTSDELIAAVQTISKEGAADGVYPFVWAGNNAPGYWDYLYKTYFAQYSSVENFYKFLKVKPTSGNVAEDGWTVFEDRGILEALKAMEPMMDLSYAPNGSINFTHTEAQHYLMVGEAGFMITGDWLLGEMQADYEEVKDCVMLKTPVLSVIGAECGITDAQLSKAVSMVDAGNTDEQIMAAISGLNAEGAARIRNARNIYYSIASSMDVMIPNYADGKHVAKLFLKFLYSEDGCRIMRNKANALVPVTCESYDVENPTKFFDSVVALMNDGKSTPIFSSSKITQIRNDCGLRDFNNSAYFWVFKSMMLDDSLTAEYIYETEKAYVKSNWQNYMASAGLA